MGALALFLGEGSELKVLIVMRAFCNVERALVSEESTLLSGEISDSVGRGEIKLIRFPQMYRIFLMFFLLL